MLATRIATALVLLVGCIAALLLLPNAWWAILLLPVLAIAGWEWCRLAQLTGLRGAAFMTIVLLSAAGCGFGVTGNASGQGGPPLLESLVYLASVLFWFVFALPWIVRRWEIRSVLALGVVGWILLVPTWVALVRLQQEPAQLLALLGIIWLSDSAALLAGRRWGKHRLAPQISPGKTWEGAAGAAAAVAVYYVALSGAMPGWKGWGGALLLTVVAVMGVVGDLFESWVKRLAGVKDSGALLPGHGGVLDRIDSMTAALPVAALLSWLAG